MRSLTLMHRSLRRPCSWLSLTLVLARSSPLSTCQWCWTLWEWYTPRNSISCARVQKWGISSWRGKRYLETDTGGSDSERGETRWGDGRLFISRDRTGRQIQYTGGNNVLLGEHYMIIGYQWVQNGWLSMNHGMPTEMKRWLFSKSLTSRQKPGSWQRGGEISSPAGWLWSCFCETVKQTSGK